MVNTKRLTLSAMFIAIGMVLPFFTGQIPEIGNMLLPMHFPVFLCGLICSWKYGLIVGFILPILRSLIFSAPIMFPKAVSMAFELAAYGLMVGLIYKENKGVLWLYLSLIVSMIGGRIIWGIVQTLLLGTGKFTFMIFITSGFIEAIPGIILQLILIPAIMITIKKLRKRESSNG
jgi:riboflavin transporter FmnP